MQLRQLVKHLDRIEEQWENSQASQTFIAEFQNGTRLLRGDGGLYAGELVL
jgi:hypothetical protein